MILYLGTDPDDADWHAEVGLPIGTLVVNHPTHAWSLAVTDRVLDEIAILRIETDHAVRIRRPFRYFPNKPTRPVSLRFFLTTSDVAPTQIQIIQRGTP